MMSEMDDDDRDDEPLGPLQSITLAAMLLFVFVVIATLVLIRLGL